MEFKYRTRVRVIHGFYEGCVGTVEDSNSNLFFGHSYYVNIDDVSNNKFVWLLESELDNE